MADLILDKALELGSALPIVLTSSTRMASAPSLGRWVSQQLCRENKLGVPNIFFLVFHEMELLLVRIRWIRESVTYGQHR